MWAFEMIHLCGKMPNARSGFDLLLDTPLDEVVIVAHFILESGLNFRWHYTPRREYWKITQRGITELS